VVPSRRFILGESRSFLGLLVFKMESFQVGFVSLSEGIIARTKAIDPFLTNVEATAAFAVENDQLAVFPGTAVRSVPDFQCDAVLLGVATVGMKNFAAGGIGASENQRGHRHCESALSSDQGKRYRELSVKSSGSHPCNVAA
jgi:hypothetical protein